jgi:hypothetical protein
VHGIYMSFPKIISARTDGAARHNGRSGNSPTGLDRSSQPIHNSLKVVSLPMA